MSGDWQTTTELPFHALTQLGLTNGKILGLYLRTNPREGPPWLRWCPGTESFALKGLFNAVSHPSPTDDISQWAAVTVLSDDTESQGNTQAVSTLTD